MSGQVSQQVPQMEQFSRFSIIFMIQSSFPFHRMATIVPFIKPDISLPCRRPSPLTKTAPSLLMNFPMTLEICHQNTNMCVWDGNRVGGLLLRPYHEGIIQFPGFQAPLEKHAKQDHYHS
jgi:hypothetical protein